MYSVEHIVNSVLCIESSVVHHVAYHVEKCSVSCVVDSLFVSCIVLIVECNTECLVLSVEQVVYKHRIWCTEYKAVYYV